MNKCEGGDQDIFIYARDAGLLEKEEPGDIDGMNECDLRRSIHVLRKYIDTLMNGLMPLAITDGQGTVMRVNDLFTGHFGINGKDIIGKNISELSGDISRLIGDTEKKTYRRRIVETVLLSPGGISYRVSVGSMSLDFNGGSGPHYSLLTFEDITEKKEAELFLKMLSSAVEFSPASVVITDAEGTIEYVNPKFTELTGYTLEESIGKNPRILKSGVQDVYFYAEMWNTILSGDVWRGDFHNIKKNGDLYWEQASISPLKNENGKITHFVAVKEDVSARRAAEDALRISEMTLSKQNNKMLRELMYAQIIVKMLLPSVPPRASWIGSEYLYLPLDEVGGDFFSFHPFSEDDLGVFIADISGHGVSSALFLSLIRSVSDRLIQKYPHNTALCLKELNDELVGSMRSYFLTAVYGHFSRKEGVTRFSFAKAGHPPPIVWRQSDGSVEVIKSRGTIIGYFEEQDFEPVTVTLEKGDRVFLYTDGVIETTNISGIMLGLSGFSGMIGGSAGRGLRDQLEDIIRAVGGYRENKPLQDDIVLIGFEIF